MRVLYKARVIPGLLNVRKKPSIDSKIVRRIKEYKVVKVYDIYNNWCKIGFNQWVQNQYLQRIWVEG